MAKVLLDSDTGAVEGAISSALISGKSSVTTLTGTEEVLVNEAGTLKKTTTQDIADLGGGGGTLSKYVMPKPTGGNITQGGNVFLNSNTTMRVGMMEIDSIDATKFYFNPASTGPTGNVKLGLFTADGQTKLWEETFTVSADGITEFTLSTTRSISRAVYYICMVPVGTTNTYPSALTCSADSFVGSTTTGVRVGTVTVAAGTLETFDPKTDVTYDSSRRHLECVFK